MQTLALLALVATLEQQERPTLPPVEKHKLSQSRHAQHHPENNVHTRPVHRMYPQNRAIESKSTAPESIQLTEPSEAQLLRRCQRAEKKADRRERLTVSKSSRLLQQAQGRKEKERLQKDFLELEREND